MPTRRDFVRTGAAVAGALSVPAVPRSLFREPAPLRILILGGTGFIGPHEVGYARERGHTLTLFNRGRTAPELFPGIEQLRGDRGSTSRPSRAGNGTS